MIHRCGEAPIDPLPRDTSAGKPVFTRNCGEAVFTRPRRFGAPSAGFTCQSTDMVRQILAPMLTAPQVENMRTRDTSDADLLGALHISGALTKTVRDDNMPDSALEPGSRAAAITVSRPGTNPPGTHEL